MRDKINYSMIPVHCRYGVQAWVEKGQYPGDFLTAVFENNLVGAFGKADDINTYAMRSYAMFMYNEAPRDCWGSKQIMDEWYKHKGLMGLSNNEEVKDAEHSKRKGEDEGDVPGDCGHR